MNCPINGKPCSKYKGFYITEKKGEDVKTYQVCEDCLYLSSSNTTSSEIKKCSGCGKTLAEIVKDSRFGCDKCYVEFESSMEYILATVQGVSDASHKGRKPYLWRKEQAETSSPVSFATELSQKLRIAKKNEDYKLAAKLKSTLDFFGSKLSEYHNADEERAPSIKKELAEFIFKYRESESADGLQ